MPLPGSIRWPRSFSLMHKRAAAQKPLSILVAYTKNSRVIGSGGRIPWNLPSERTRFKQICRGRRVIMGRKSFEEIGHALSYCTIVIVSRSMAKAVRCGRARVPEGCLLAGSFEEAVQMAQEPTSEGGECTEKSVHTRGAGNMDGTENAADVAGAEGANASSDEVLVAGGEEIYAQALPYTTRIYATEILADISGDRLFPKLPGGTSAWSKKAESRHQDTKSGIWYEYITYEKIS